MTIFSLPPRRNASNSLWSLQRRLVPHLFWQPLRNIPSLVHIFSQVVKALDVLYELLRSSPPREQVQTALLDWGAEQLYCLLLTPSFGDKVRERVFRVRTTHQEPLVSPFAAIPRANFHSCHLSWFRQILFKLLKSERVSERHKQRVKLKDYGYLGLVCFLEDIPVTMVTVQCLYGQVLATGTALGSAGICSRQSLKQVASEALINHS